MISFNIINLCLQNCLCPSDILTKYLCAVFISLVSFTCPVHFILLSAPKIFRTRGFCISQYLQCKMILKSIIIDVVPQVIPRCRLSTADTFVPSEREWIFPSCYFCWSPVGGAAWGLNWLKSRVICLRCFARVMLGCLGLGTRPPARHAG